MDIGLSSGEFRIAVGLLLLPNPLYVGQLHLDEPNWYRYEATEITYDDANGIEVDIHVGDIDDDVACFAQLPSRACALEHLIHENGNVTSPVTWGKHVSAYGPNGYRYVYVDGEFYETEANETANGTVFSLNRTDPDDAMHDVATPISKADPKVRNAIRNGNVTTRHELDGADELVRDGDDYYVVYAAAYEVHGGHTYRSEQQIGRLLEGGLTVTGIVVGLLLVLRGQRRRVLHE